MPWRLHTGHTLLFAAVARSTVHRHSCMFQRPVTRAELFPLSLSREKEYRLVIFGEVHTCATHNNFPEDTCELLDSWTLFK